MKKHKIVLKKKTSKILKKIAKKQDRDIVDILNNAVSLYVYLDKHGVKPGSRKKLCVLDLISGKAEMAVDF